MFENEYVFFGFFCSSCTKDYNFCFLSNAACMSFMGWVKNSILSEASEIVHYTLIDA